MQAAPGRRRRLTPTSLPPLPPGQPDPNKPVHILEAPSDRAKAEWMQAFQLVATSAALIDAAIIHSSWVRGVQRTICKGQLEKVLSEF